MTCGHLFNGIGGFALAAHWMGWDNVMHCEIDPFCNQVMNYYFPNSYQHEDIRTTDFTIWRGRIELLTGGFPCQPYSTAGKRKGKADERHLWPEMLRSIREIQPRWIVGENVRGLISWNGGMVFDEVCADLEAEGYAIFPVVLPAAGVNAPHKRERIWFIAHAKSSYRNISKKSGNGKKEMDAVRDGAEGSTSYTDSSVQSGRLVNRGYSKETTGDQRKDQQPPRWNEDGERFRVEPCAGGETTTDSEGLGKREQADENDAIAEGREARIEFSGSDWREHDRTDWQQFPTQPPICFGNDGLSTRLDPITVPSKKYGTRILTGKQAYGWWRKQSLKAAGNAIVPRVAFEIFKAIESYERHLQPL